MKLPFGGAFLILVLFLLTGCSSTAETSETFVVASTTSTQDSGFLDAVGPAFEGDHPQYRPKVVAVGSGEAIELGRRGDADVLLTHSPRDEERFMVDGLGVFRRPVMQNDFVIAGPADDAARVAEASDGPDAFRRISATRVQFVSRADDSGTHKRELETWERAGIQPTGDWYLESGQGMAETLRIAAERQAYVLTDTATFRVIHNKGGLVFLFESDPAFINPYSVIPVAEARHLAAATAFAEWLTGTKGQTFIRTFGVKEFGSALFIPAGTS